jgi:hypothetical protein
MYYLKCGQFAKTVFSTYIAGQWKCGFCCDCSIHKIQWNYSAWSFDESFRLVKINGITRRTKEHHYKGGENLVMKVDVLKVYLISE